MGNINECLMHYNKLLALLEDDLVGIKGGFQGELMDAYRSVVKEEINEVQNKIRALKRVCNEI